MKKRILSVLLATLMVLGSVGTFAVGTAAEYEGFTIAVECGDITDEGTVHVEVVMYNNPGLSSAVFALDFDETVLKLVDYDKASGKNPKTCLAGATTNLTSVRDITKLGEVAYSYSLAGANYENGVLLGVTFEIIADVE